MQDSKKFSEGDFAQMQDLLPKGTSRDTDRCPLMLESTAPAVTRCDRIF